MRRNEVCLWTQNQKGTQSYTLGYANRCFTARNLPAYVAVPHFPRRDEVCVYDGPWARITVADKNHARFQLQRSIEPRHSVRGASSYFDLNDLRHYAFARPQNAAPAKHVRISWWQVTFRPTVT